MLARIHVCMLCACMHVCMCIVFGTVCVCTSSAKQSPCLPYSAPTCSMGADDPAAPDEGTVAPTPPDCPDTDDIKGLPLAAVENAAAKNNFDDLNAKIDDLIGGMPDSFEALHKGADAAGKEIQLLQNAAESLLGKLSQNMKPDTDGKPDTENMKPDTDPPDGDLDAEMEKLKAAVAEGFDLRGAQGKKTSKGLLSNDIPTQGCFGTQV